MERIVHAYTCTVNRFTHAPFEGEKAVAKGQVARVEENIAADRIELSAE
jgi:hypothetical protein